jgi:hypothetical protein
MRRIKTVLGVVAVMAAMSVVFAAPAMADDFDFDGCDDDFFFFFDDCNNNDFFCDDDFFFFDDCNNNDDRFDDHGFFFGGDGISQDFEQEAESGDIDQSFDVSSTGDNSNQTVSTQGVANTGNTQNQIGVFQIGSDADDFEFDDGGSSIEVSPTNTTSSAQEVNQAASASD